MGHARRCISMAMLGALAIATPARAAPGEPDVAERARAAPGADAPSLGIATSAPGAVSRDAAADDDVAGELEVPPAAVVFRGQPLFSVRDTLGPRAPDERAAAIAGRLEDLSSRGSDESLRVEVRDRRVTTDLVVGETVLMTVTAGDAAPTGRTRMQLAADYARIIELRLARDVRERSFEGIVRAAVATAIATAVFAFLLFALGFIARRVRHRLQNVTAKRIKGLRIQNLDLLPARRVIDLLDRTVGFLRSIGVIVLVLVYLNSVLSFFPWTRAVAFTLFAQLRSAAAWVLGGILGYVPNLFYIAAIAVVAMYVLRFIHLVFREIERGTVAVPGFYPDWASPTYKIIRFLLLAFVAVIIFPYLPGSKSPAFQGVSIFLGLLLSLGSTAAVANVVAGVVLTYMRPFAVGDRVKIADTIGDVVQKTLLVVRIRTVKNVEITIANAMVLNNHIINYSACARDEGLVLHTTVTIGYDVPYKQVHELLESAAAVTDGVVAGPAPFVLQTSLDDFYVSYELNAFTNEPQRMSRIYSDLHAHIQDRFNEAGVEILSPHYRAPRDGNASTIPADYLPKDYRPPAFRVLPLGKLEE